MGINLTSIGVLFAVTILYAGYNIFIKASGNYIPVSATTTVLAAICLQLAALFTSIVFLSILTMRGGHSFSLSSASYLWAVIAGLSIGVAEIGYFYLFSGIGSSKPMAASVAIPTVVAGTIIIAMIVSVLFFGELFTLPKLAGSLLVIAGVVVFFLPQNIS